MKKKKIERSQKLKKIYDNDNIFAKILRLEISCLKVDENDYALAFMDINPQALLHVLVIPKKSYIDFYDFTSNASSNEITSFWKLITKIILKKNLKKNGYRLITNSGNDANQDVYHYHVHLLAGQNLCKIIS